MERGVGRSWLDDPSPKARHGEPAPAPAKPTGALEPASLTALSPTVQRRAVCDQVFGPGFRLPGGEAELLRLVRPLHLAPSARLLVVGSNVAGPCRALMARLRVQVSGFERHSGPARADGSDQGAEVGTAAWWPGESRLPAGEFHNVLGLNVLADEVPEPVLAEITGALRPGGQIIIVEYVATDTFDLADPDTRDWMHEEDRMRPPDTEQDLARALGRLSLNLHSTEDISRAHTRLAVFDWRRMLNGMRERPTASGGQSMLAEAEMWRLRARLLEQDQIRLIRLHATLMG